MPKAALPSGLKLESETVVVYNPDFEATEPLRSQEQTLLDAFAGTLKLTISELERKAGLHNAVSLVMALMKKGAVEVSEEVKRKFVPKMQTIIRLSAAYQSEEKLQAAFTELKRAQRQEQLLLCFLERCETSAAGLSTEIPKSELLERSGCSSAVLDGLLKRGILEGSEKEIAKRDLPAAWRYLQRKNRDLCASDCGGTDGRSSSLVSAAGNCHHDANHGASVQTLWR